MRPHWRRLRKWGFAADSLISIFCRCVYCDFGLIHAPVGGHGFEIRGARAIFFLGFWCFGEQFTKRKKAGFVRRTGGGCEYGGKPRVAYFSFFVVACIAVFV